MIEFYPEIKFVHVLCVVLSGSMFAFRGATRMLDWRYANHAVLRYASYTIDTTLLTAALMLVTLLHQYPFVQAWLTVKVLLLVVYVALGTLALKRGRTRGIRAACYAGALAVFLFIVSVARAHDPWGALSAFLR
jgi:uncharacterized membrane protein SirB2